MVGAGDSWRTIYHHPVAGRRGESTGGMSRKCHTWSRKCHTWLSGVPTRAGHSLASRVRATPHSAGCGTCRSKKTRKPTPYLLAPATSLIDPNAWTPERARSSSPPTHAIFRFLLCADHAARRATASGSGCAARGTSSGRTLTGRNRRNATAATGVSTACVWAGGTAQESARVSTNRKSVRALEPKARARRGPPTARTRQRPAPPDAHARSS